MVGEQATEAAQGKATKLPKKKADTDVVVPKTSDDEEVHEYESEAEESEEDPPPTMRTLSCVRGFSRVVSQRS